MGKKGKCVLMSPWKKEVISLLWGILDWKTIVNVADFIEMIFMISKEDTFKLPSLLFPRRTSLYGVGRKSPPFGMVTWEGYNWMQGTLSWQKS